MLSCVWRGQCDICNWLFVAHILKVSAELKATHRLTTSLTDKPFVTISQSRGTSSVLSMESYQYAFSALLSGTAAKQRAAFTSTLSIKMMVLLHVRCRRLISRRMPKQWPTQLWGCQIGHPPPVLARGAL